MDTASSATTHTPTPPPQASTPATAATNPSLPCFPSARQPAILRSHQRDLTQVSQLTQLTTQVLRSIFGSSRSSAAVLSLPSFLPSLAHHRNTTMLHTGRVGQRQVLPKEHLIGLGSALVYFGLTFGLGELSLFPGFLPPTWSRTDACVASW
jgi:hypothetical protein